MESLLYPSFIPMPFVRFYIYIETNDFSCDLKDSFVMKVGKEGSLDLLKSKIKGFLPEEEFSIYRISEHGDDVEIVNDKQLFHLCIQSETTKESTDFFGVPDKKIHLRISRNKQFSASMKKDSAIPLPWKPILDLATIPRQHGLCHSLDLVPTGYRKNVGENNDFITKPKHRSNDKKFERGKKEMMMDLLFQHEERLRKIEMKLMENDVKQPIISFKSSPVDELNEDVFNEQFVHNATCDECESIIKGHRFKCYFCTDYDLCSKCEANGKHSHHAMLRIVSPILTKLPTLNKGSANNDRKANILKHQNVTQNNLLNDTNPGILADFSHLIPSNPEINNALKNDNYQDNQTKTEMSKFNDLPLQKVEKLKTTAQKALDVQRKDNFLSRLENLKKASKKLTPNVQAMDSEKALENAKNVVELLEKVKSTKEMTNDFAKEWRNKEDVQLIENFPNNKNGEKDKFKVVLSKSPSPPRRPPPPRFANEEVKTVELSSSSECESESESDNSLFSEYEKLKDDEVTEAKNFEKSSVRATLGETDLPQKQLNDERANSTLNESINPAANFWNLDEVQPPQNTPTTSVNNINDTAAKLLDMGFSFYDVDRAIKAVGINCVDCISFLLQQ